MTSKAIAEAKALAKDAFRDAYGCDSRDVVAFVFEDGRCVGFTTRTGRMVRVDPNRDRKTQ